MGQRALDVPGGVEGVGVAGELAGAQLTYSGLYNLGLESYLAVSRV